jgi:hypothetical protein
MNFMSSSSEAAILKRNPALPIAVVVQGDEVVISYPEEADTKRDLVRCMTPHT